MPSRRYRCSVCPWLFQLTLSSFVQQRQLTGDLADIRRQLNTSTTDISDVSTSLDDVTAAATRLLTSAQAVHDNVTTATPYAVDLSSVQENVTRLEVLTTSLDNEVRAHVSHVSLPRHELLINTSSQY